MDSNSEDFDSDSILYELLEYFIKKQEPELIRFKNDNTILPTTGTIKNALRYLNNRYSLPESISQEISLTLPWKFAIGDNGKLLALAQENIIEIRRSKDEFSSIIGKASVPKDAFPQWRKLAWAPDGSILVLASSNGCLSFYNSMGSNIFNICPKTELQNPEILEAGDAITSLMFNKSKNDDKWTYEFLLVTYSGLLKSYNINLHGYQVNYEFSFGNFYRKGVNAFAYDKIHNLYIVAGNSITQQFLSPAANAGLTSWRPLNDYPHYKLSFTFDEKSTSHGLSLWNLIPKFHAPEEPVIFRISISPSCEHLVCLHTDGSISLWNLPNLQLMKKWKLNEQPNYNAQNPLGSLKHKKFPIGLTEFHPIDIGWWSTSAIIVARYSGAISVCSMINLKNLLGASPEFLSGQPQISEFYSGKGFLCLDCETFITSKKRSIEANNDGHNSEASDSEREEDEVEAVTLMNYTTNLLCSALYSITDIERFQPKRKKSKILQRTYRILGLKSTTPEELYSRKIDIEEYDEALALANAYNLDTDLVYQTQWRKSSFSLNAIQEHLSKVRKRTWVLNECIMRVPETLDAAKELLNFGLKGANLHTFLAVVDNDDGQFVTEEINEELAELDEVTAELRYTHKANEVLKNIDLSSLKQSQKDLLVCRRSLLNHRDKLKTYEIIIQDSSNYKKELYEEFRQLTWLENAVKFAKDCNYRAVEIMFTYHGQKLMPHWLAIISSFPETLNPIQYEKLLPECDDNGQLFLLYQKELRPRDWAEKHEFEAIIDNNNDDDSRVLYESDSWLSIYKNTELTMELLVKWYKSRAYQIERNSCIVENALELIKIGKKHKITGLEDFLVTLETLDDLVYKIYLENMSLAQFEKLTDLEKVQLLMSTATDKNFVEHIKSYILPFIHRKKKYCGESLDKKLLRDYLIMLSETDLTLPLKFFETAKHDIDILDVVEDIMTLAFDCIYSCTNYNMYTRAKYIFDTLPKPQIIRDATGATHPMEDMERELECLKILNKHRVQTTARFIHTSKHIPEDIKFLLQQMSNSSSGAANWSEEDWSELLNDMLELQEFIFTCIDTETCFEIHVTSRLASAVKITIENCRSLIETKKSEHSLLKVSYEKAVELILEASKEYFNSSKSLNDPNMELARTCLHLIEDDNPLIQGEYDLIHSLQILDEFNINILPLQVRLSHDRLKLIENCLDHRRDAYKRQQRLLTLATYLRIEGNNTRNREGKVLELVANKAIEAEDYDTCASTCQRLIENSYFAAWKIIRKLGFTDDFNDLNFKQQCLTFALTYGPSEILEETLRQMHLLEIQVLNKNLENLMVNCRLDDQVDGDSDDEFIDAMTTPQNEVKEFVPKIFETSTGLVKSSAEIVKQSTLGILKNVSNRNFWNTLKLNGKTDGDDLNETEIIENREQRNEIQSFPYFYESLHSACCISRIDTKYDSYSLPEVESTELKVCQTLLRVALLSETSCYGLEVSDINHFLVQAASATMPDDWPLGFAYLLSLKCHDSMYVDEVFKNLPNTPLWIQTAMYFHSLQLYRKLKPECTDYLTYDPLELIKAMLAEVKDAEDDTKKALSQWYQRWCEHNEPSQVDVKEEKYDKIEKLEEIPRDQTPNIAEAVTTTNLYDSDAFKLKDNEETEDAGWDDNWSDGWEDNRSDHSEKATVQSFVASPDNLFDDHEMVDSALEVPKTINSTQNDLHLDNTPTVIDDSTESVRFNIFEDLYSHCETKDAYLNIKNVLQLWPAFIDEEFTTAKKHPILRMIKISNLFINDKHSTKCEESKILQEYKDLLRNQIISPDVYVEFIREFDENCLTEEGLFLRLCSDNPVLHEEAIVMIKNQNTRDYSLTLLEEIFFKNLTSLLPPHHPVYNKILEQIFLNHDLSKVESHIRILIDKLVEQKHIPYAIALWNQLAAIPPALSTFENCFQLFMKK